MAGILLVGLVTDEDQLFAAAGHALARLAPNGLILYVGAIVLVVSVTTVLNLDTSVAFLTPILVYTARTAPHRHGTGDLLRRPAQPLATRHQREHQRPLAPLIVR